MITRHHKTQVVDRCSIFLLSVVTFVVLSNENNFAHGLEQPQVPLQEQPPQAAQATAPWYETLPAVAMDYKVIIDPGKEDCYFQYVNQGATFYASAQV